MAEACGLALGKDWLSASTGVIKEISVSTADDRSAQKLKDDYRAMTTVQQKTGPQMDCADVSRLLDDCERELSQ